MTGLFSPRIRGLSSQSPFTGPETLERKNAQAFAARLGANESVFGPSPKAIEAMTRVSADGWMYGDPEQFELREALAAKLGLMMTNIICGVGIDGLLRDLIAAATEPGDTVLTSLGAYPTFGYFATAAGVTIETVPYTAGFQQDWPALAERARELRPKILYLTNPDNPTGSWRSAEELRDLLAEVPEDTLVALDEAYCDFAQSDVVLPTDLVRPNLLRFRTFSKAYGMAGVRVGYVFGDSAAIENFQKVRDHFAVTRLSQAGAVAALRDEDHLRHTIEAVEKGRVLLSLVAERCGFRALPSATNFVAMDLGGDSEYCRKIAEQVEKNGVFVRRPGAEFLNRTLRVSIGTPSDIERFEKALVAAIDAVGPY